MRVTLARLALSEQQHLCCQPGELDATWETVIWGRGREISVSVSVLTLRLLVRRRQVRLASGTVGWLAGEKGHPA